MTDSNTTPPTDDRGDEPPTWNAEPREGSAKPAGDAAPSSAAASLLESLREAIDDMTERATPTVREVSARVAELTAAAAAAKAAPFAKKAGDATADASGKLAERSRTWAAEVRASMPGAEHEAPAARCPDGDRDRAARRPADRPAEAANAPVAAGAPGPCATRPNVQKWGCGLRRRSSSADERPTDRPPRRPAPAPEGQARRQLRQVPARAARRPRPHDARRARRRPGGAPAG